MRAERWHAILCACAHVLKQDKQEVFFPAPSKSAPLPPPTHALMAATARFAASSKSDAAMICTPELRSTALPSSTLVPARRTTSGTLSLISFTASTMPVAMVSHWRWRKR